MNKIRFKRDTAFRKQFFVPDSFAHPAKMDAQLLVWIVEHYTKAGETILDPMAGSGTMMLACMMGRHVIGVELESKFCDMAKANWEKVRQKPMLGSTMGTCQIIQGDARQLEGLLVDKIVTSPPYAEAKSAITDKEWLREHQDELSMNSPSRHGAHQRENQHHERLIIPDNPSNIGNLPYGNIDSIITSPPYEESVSASTGGERDMSSARQREKRLRDKGYDPAKYQGGVGRNCEVDFQYSKSEDNIGNLKSQSYLEAMLQVYQQCHKVLKPEGLMALVTKNFIRNKQIVKLDEDTIKLCNQAGFSFIERYYRELPSQSFWRIIYHKKYPNVEQILNEDVLVFSK